MTVVSKPAKKPYLPANPAPHPYNLPVTSPVLTRLYHPSTAGILTASLASFGYTPGLPRLISAPWGHVTRWTEGGLISRVVGSLPRQFYVLIAAFAWGYLTFRCLDWVRWRLLRILLGYRGWLYAPNTVKTKVWGMTVRTLLGAGYHSTYTLQPLLPRQPLPELSDTLNTWLDASRQFVTPEEFEATKDAVKCFKQTDGPKLQAYLQQKSQRELSWLADYWLTAAYLANRDPIAVYNNYYITTGFPLVEPRPGQLMRATAWIYNHARLSELLDDQEYPPTLLLGTIPICMYAYGHVYGTVRVPGEHLDSVLKYNDKHVMIIREGHYFKLDMYARDAKRGRRSLLTPEEILHQLQDICQRADALPDESPVAALTAQHRHVWAKQRERLQAKNRGPLHDVESAMFIFCLDDQAPDDVNELCRHVLTGNGLGHDRWYDKCFTGVSFSDGMTGMNVEHSVIDATVFGTVCEYCAIHEDDVIHRLQKPSSSIRPMDCPSQLVWDLSGLEEDIKRAAQQCHAMAEDLDLCLHYCKYGKGFMKMKRVSPDGYIQMMFQLAYYRLYKEIPKTYEPATGRLFLLGRTETVHPGSPQSVAWVKAMDDPSFTCQTRQQLFRKAVKQQNAFRLAATGGAGCDRHLLGLLCASRELGMDLPGIFMNKAWTLPHVLSTSQTPTRSWEFGTPVNYDCASGGFGPGCKQGYGISYIIYGDEQINMAVTSWKSGAAHNSEEFADAIGRAMEDTQTMLS